MSWTCPRCGSSNPAACVTRHGEDDGPGPVGIKHDGGKLRWSLVPWEAMSPVVRVLQAGAAKYAPGNWRHVVAENPTRYWDAALRHLLAWQQGERTDAETGESHLAHAACCVLFLLAGEGGRTLTRPPWCESAVADWGCNNTDRIEGCHCLPGTRCAQCQAELDKAIKGEG